MCSAAIMVLVTGRVYVSKIGKPQPPKRPQPRAGAFLLGGEFTMQKGVRCSPPSMKESDQPRTSSPAKIWGLAACLVVRIPLK